tara:strand:+ start:2168 stop:2836 length:669 start_codon:yes stop_codon:yes gene_type:complete
MAFDAAIFDLDGTLLDTLDDLADSGNEMLESQGFPTHPVDGYRTFVGDGVRVLMERILPPEAKSEETIERCMKVYREAYQRRWNAKTKPYAGIPEMLDGMVERGIRLAVLSNKPHDFTQQCIEEFVGNWPWEIVFGMREGVPKKPDPAGAIQILETMKVSPENVLYLGDTDTDMKTAKGAKLHAVGVLWGFRQREELVEHGADLLLERPGDMLTFLDSQLQS